MILTIYGFVILLYVLSYIFALCLTLKRHKVQGVTLLSVFLLLYFQNLEQDRAYHRSHINVCSTTEPFSPAGTFILVE